MKSFREYLAEASLEKSSMMSGGEPKGEVYLDAKKGLISVWVNGGNPYVIKSTPEIVSKMRQSYDADVDAFMEKYFNKLAVKVADLLNSEVSKWEKDFK